MKKGIIGVLALQGCVKPHQKHIEAAGHIYREVRTQEDLENIQGLILPGGESTTQLKLIANYSLEAPLQAAFKKMPVWGICAGAILLSRQVRSPEQRSFNLIDVEIGRNSYGRQLESFTSIQNGFEVAFIRAPKILSWGKTVEVIASQDNSPIWVQSRKCMLTTFHAELNPNAPSPIHEHFLSLI